MSAQKKQPVSIHTARRTYESDSLDPAPRSVEMHAVDVTAPKPAADTQPLGLRSIQRTVSWNAEILDRARAAAVYLRSYGGPDVDDRHKSLSGIANQATDRLVDELEYRYNDGQPFPRLTGMMPAGRPPGS
jgi:hypothetical protein